MFGMPDTMYDRMLKAGGVCRGAKSHDIFQYPLSVYRDPAGYVIFTAPSRSEARRELLAREENILNILDAMQGLEAYEMFGEEFVHNLRIVREDLQFTRKGQYDCSKMAKYRQYDLITKSRDEADEDEFAPTSMVVDLFVMPNFVADNFDPYDNRYSIKEYEIPDDLDERSEEYLL